MTKSSIKLSKWNNNLSVGVDVIDNDHKKLFSLLRQIKEFIDSGKTPPIKAIEKLLSDLYAHTDLHFNREETLMKACGYPHYENHRHVHNMIRTQVKYYLDSYQDSKASLNLELLLGFMETWLIDHIGGMDKSYSTWMMDKEDLIDKANKMFEMTWKREGLYKEAGNKLKLLVVDDEEDICEAICTHAKRLEHDATYITEGEQFSHVYSDEFKVVVLDLFMPNIDGIELIRYLADQNSKSAIILMSGKDDSVLHSARILAESRGLNVVGVLNKPFNREDIHLLLSKIEGQEIKQSTSSESSPITKEELQAAIDKEELVPYFQPKVRIDTGKTVGFEALARWIHPEKGLVSPGIFIPLYEKYNLIGGLTDLMMEKTFAQTSLWIKAGFKLKASINVSPMLLKNLDTPEKLIAMTNKHGLDSSVVTLEVTESAMSEELANSLDILTRIRMKGFLLSIDDFGTGYSSMMQLNRAPFNELKVDQSFVMNMDTDEENRAICESTIDLAHKLNMTVCAEGIETKAVWDILREFYCTEAQGYYFGKPMPADEFEVWYKERSK
jgi:hemerythrin-like metal-binding protein